MKRSSETDRANCAISTTSSATSGRSGAAYVAAVSFAGRAASRRTKSRALFRAVTSSQARGSRGTPVCGQVRSAARAASCTASCASCKLPNVRVRVATTLAPATRIVRASPWAGWVTRSVLLVQPDDRAKLDLPAIPGRRDLSGPLDRVVQVGRLDQEVAAEHLLGLGVRAIGDDDVAALAVGDGNGRRH